MTNLKPSVSRPVIVDNGGLSVEICHELVIQIGYGVGDCATPVCRTQNAYINSRYVR